MSCVWERKGRAKVRIGWQRGARVDSTHQRLVPESEGRLASDAARPGECSRFQYFDVVWGMEESSFKHVSNKKIFYYQYTNSYPHSGAGVRVQF